MCTSAYARFLKVNFIYIKVRCRRHLHVCDMSERYAMRVGLNIYVVLGKAPMIYLLCIFSPDP